MAVPLILAALLLGTLLQEAPVPPPIPQATADCGHPVYATDMLVCDDPQLRTLDERLKAALVSLPARVTANPAPTIESEDAWFRRSRRCAFEVEHRACAMAAYRERLSVLAAQTSPLRVSGECRLTDGTISQFAESGGSAVLLRNGLAIAIGLPAVAAWRPFVRYLPYKRRATLLTIDGKLLARCRLRKESR